MRYETAKDLLVEAARLHEGLGRYYSQLSSEAGKERVRMLLDYLVRHETNMAAVLSRYSKETANNVRNAWFTYALDSAFAKCIPPAPPVDQLSIDEIINLAIQLDDHIIDLYQLIALESELPEAREAFTNLVQLERQEKMRMVRQAMGLKDL